MDESPAKPIPLQPDRPEIALAQEEEDGLPTDINLGLQTPIGGDVYGTSYMNDEMESQFAGVYNQTNPQEEFDSWGRRKQKKFMRQNPNMFQRGRR